MIFGGWQNYVLTIASTQCAKTIANSNFASCFCFFVGFTGFWSLFERLGFILLGSQFCSPVCSMNFSCKEWKIAPPPMTTLQIYHINWCRISSINSIKHVLGDSKWSFDPWLLEVTSPWQGSLKNQPSQKGHDRRIARFIYFLPPNKIPRWKKSHGIQFDIRIFCRCFYTNFGVSKPFSQAISAGDLKLRDLAEGGSDPTVDVDVSENSGFSQIIHLFIGFSMKKTIHFGVPLFLETAMLSWNMFAKMMNILNLGGVFFNDFSCSTRKLGDDEFWRAYFSNGLKPPTT